MPGDRGSALSASSSSLPFVASKDIVPYLSQQAFKLEVLRFFIQHRIDIDYQNWNENLVKIVVF
eukprot:m.636770 g.636770  ORF g.636770 m.636770 type:complete len:64 (+) comp58312_c0_seq27:807-998(+)